MTQNQIAFAQYLEAARHNLAGEEDTDYYNTEISRHNLATETETARNNRVVSKETKRHNKAFEKETKRSNKAREKENTRSNKAREKENTRSNKAREKENTRHNKATELFNNQNLDETRRHNYQTEQQARDDMNQRDSASQRSANATIQSAQISADAARDTAATNAAIQKYRADMEKQIADADRDYNKQKDAYQRALQLRMNSDNNETKKQIAEEQNHQQELDRLFRQAQNLNDNNVAQQEADIKRAQLDLEEKWKKHNIHKDYYYMAKDALRSLADVVKLFILKK